MNGRRRGGNFGTQKHRAAVIKLLGAATSFVGGAFAAGGTGAQRTKARLFTAGASLEMTRKSKLSSKPDVPLGRGLKELLTVAVPGVVVGGMSRLCGSEECRRKF